MGESYQWDFGSVASGLQFKIVFDGTGFTVTCTSGYLDLNALWFSDGDKSTEGTVTLAKSDNSLNMNGTGITWDDVYKVSSTGLGSTGTNKASFLTAGESMSFSLATLDLPESISSLLANPTLLTIGVRVTSDSSTSGEGKYVDTSGTLISSVNHAPTLATVSNGTVTDTAGDDSYANVTGTLHGSDADGNPVSYELAGSSASSGTGDSAGFNVQKSSDYGTFYLNTASGAYKFVANDAAVEGLKTTQTADFTVNATDGVADSATQTISISLDGVNDTPELSASLTAFTFIDTSGNDSFTSVTGQLTSTDRDVGDTASYAIDDTSAATGSFDVNGHVYQQKLVGNFGTLYLDTSGAYEYVPNDSAVEALEASTSESFTLKVTDGSNATATQTLTINLTGAEDAPEVTAVVADYADTEADDTFPDTTGTLNVSSRDGDSSFTFTLSGSSDSVLSGYDRQDTSSTFGTLYLNSTSGAYKFIANDAAIEALESGSIPNAVYHVTAAADGVTSADQTITITFAGAEDAPVVAPVVESYLDTAADDTFADKTGTLDVTSRDGDSSFTFALAGSSATGQLDYDLKNASSGYGTLYLNSSTGAYKFVANDAAIEGLESGSNPSAIYHVTAAADNATSSDQTITINLNGAEDAPVVAPVVASYTDTAADDTFTDKTGTLGVTSRDGDSSFTFALAGSSATGELDYDLQNTSSPFGTLYLNSTSGAYKFVANDAAIEALQSGSNPSLVYAVTASADGATSASQSITLGITGGNDAPRDLTLTADTSNAFITGNGVPGNNGAIGTISVTAGSDPDAGGSYSFSLFSAKSGIVGAASISTDASGLFAVSSAGALSSTTGLASGTIYEVTVQASQGSGATLATYNETFSVVTGTNAGTETLPGGGYDFSSGDDVIYGRQNVDIILAGSGDDTVFGQDGNDEIHGGTGIDLLFGGKDNDSFVFSTGNTGITLATADTIGDFNSANDTIVTSLAAGNVTIANGSSLSDFNAFVAAANASMATGTATSGSYMAWNAAGTGNGWLVIDENHSNSVDSGDSLIVLTGVNTAAGFATTDIA